MSNLDDFVVLDLDSGTFFSAATSVILDTRRLTESQLEILNEGSDGERCDLASEYGSELENIIDTNALKDHSSD